MRRYLSSEHHIIKRQLGFTDELRPHQPAQRIAYFTQVIWVYADLFTMRALTGFDIHHTEVNSPPIAVMEGKIQHAPLSAYGFHR